MSTSFGLWLVEKLQNLITDPEFRASAKGSISYYGAGIRPVLLEILLLEPIIADTKFLWPIRGGLALCKLSSERWTNLYQKGVLVHNQHRLIIINLTWPKLVQKHFVLC